MSEFFLFVSRLGIRNSSSSKKKGLLGKIGGHRTSTGRTAWNQRTTVTVRRVVVEAADFVLVQCKELEVRRLVRSKNNTGRLDNTAPNSTWNSVQDDFLAETHCLGLSYD